MNGVFTYRNFSIEFIQIGDGQETFFAFHGFGRKPEDFGIFQTVAKPHQRIIALSLFAHGKSVFPEGRIDKQPLSSEEWRELMLALMQLFLVEKFHLIGYSMGGRISLMTLQIMPEFVENVLLLAPDGLKINLLYKFASGTKLGKNIYRSIIENPSFLFSLAKWLNKCGLLHDKLHRFVHVHLDTREKRWQVHDAWLIYKNMFPDLKKVAAIIQNRPEKFNMIFGQFDSIIRPELGYRFSKLIGDEKHIHVVNAGHRLLTEDTVRFIQDKNLL